MTDSMVASGVPNQDISIGSTVLMLPSSVELIASGFFYQDAMTEVRVSANMHTIGSYAFSECVHLNIFDLPPSLMELGEGVFYHCSAL